MPFDGSVREDDPSNIAILKRLLAARRRIKRGWCRGEAVERLPTLLHPVRGSLHFCAWGAIHAGKAEFVDSPSERACEVICDVIGIPCDEAELWAWNDAPGRTKKEVLAVFDRAIARFSA